MKKMSCILLLILLGVSCNCFSNKQFEEVINLNHVSSIKAIVDDCCEVEGVFNGNKKIVEVKDFNQLHNLKYQGVTIILDKNGFDRKSIFDNYNLTIVNKYLINGNYVYDCKIDKYSICGFSSMQIVERKTDVVIGVPMILNDF